MARVTIVGGGYTGAATAMQLVSAAGPRIEITIVEPREQLGRGMAYSTTDPDHRLNGPLDSHLLDPARTDDLRRWCEEKGVFDRDPESLAANGGIFLRRGDFGAYVGDALRGRCRHHRSRALALHDTTVLTEDDARIAGDLVVIATGNAPAALPAMLQPLADHPSLVREPLDAARLAAIEPEARVLLVGGGLTALDVMSTLLRRRARGKIVALSRRGVRPRSHRARVPDNGIVRVLARLAGPLPVEVERALHGGGIRRLTRELRKRIDEERRAGGDWQVPFDELRDRVVQFWPRLPLADKWRFLRHLRIWYDAHRFRAPPQNEAMVREAERAGQVQFVTGRMREAKAGDGRTIGVSWESAGTVAQAEFDVLVNCTGLDAACGASTNPFLAGLLAAGHIRRDPTGIGFEVDEQCRPLRRDGAPSAKLRMVGPPTAGTFGDPLGVIFIAPQIRRMLPGLLAEIGLSPIMAA